jgi:hypothetical protein
MTPGVRKQVRVPAVRDYAAALDDGFSWRKYGQKEILGAKYPRSAHAHVTSHLEKLRHAYEYYSPGGWITVTDTYVLPFLQVLLQVHAPEHAELPRHQAGAARRRRPAALPRRVPRRARLRPGRGPAAASAWARAELATGDGGDRRRNSAALLRLRPCRRRRLWRMLPAPLADELRLRVAASEQAGGGG